MKRVRKSVGKMSKSIDKIIKKYQWKIVLVGLIIGILSVFNMLYSVSVNVRKDVHITPSGESVIKDTVVVCVTRKGTNNTICTTSVEVPS